MARSRWARPRSSEGWQEHRATGYRYHVLAEEEPQTGEVTLPFIAPAGAEIETFSLESKTTIDIATLAANAKAAKP